MFYLSLILLFIVLNVVCDVNYFVRTLFTILSGRVLGEKRNLYDVTAIYGLGTFQDCDIDLKRVRLARLIRELDMGRFYYYVVTGIYRRSQQLQIHALQGCTFTIEMDPLPIFVPYKISTKLIYWDEKTLFFEHEVITLHDNKRRGFLLSRQHAIGPNGLSTEALLKDFPGVENKPECPEYIVKWLKSMEISSAKLRENYLTSSH